MGMVALTLKNVLQVQLATKRVKRNVMYKHVKSRIKELYFESEKMNEKQETTRSEVNNNISCLNMVNLISKQTNKHTASEIFRHEMLLFTSLRADHSSHSYYSIIYFLFDGVITDLLISTSALNLLPHSGLGPQLGGHLSRNFENLRFV